MVATPLPNRKIPRRKSQFPLDGSDADNDSSSAAETTSSIGAKSIRRRGLPKFTEHIDEAESTFTPATSPDGDATPSPKANGHANGSAEGLADGKVPAKERIADGWKPGMDPKVDNSGVFEFGGSFGTLAMMLGFPVLMWYMWIGATYYGGKAPMREPGQSWSEFGSHMFNLVYTGAFPHAKAWAMYWIFFTFEGALYCLLPGVKAYGKPLPTREASSSRIIAPRILRSTPPSLSPRPCTSAASSRCTPSSTSSVRYSLWPSCQATSSRSSRTPRHSSAARLTA